MIGIDTTSSERFGRLDTWIVGIQYYDGARDLDAPVEVFFERTPDNPFDANAIAVYTRDGQQIGHLPRHDARYLSPLMAAGVVALKGAVVESEHDYRLPLTLEVYATAKVTEILTPDAGNDWRAIYHNLFVGVWQRLGEYSSFTLEAFRRRFRPLAHEQSLYPKTHFLYRMLKAHIVDAERREEMRLREQMRAAIASMNLGRVMGWSEMMVIPIVAQDSPAAPANADMVVDAVFPDHEARMSEVLRLLPSRCPYPAGARGVVVLVHGEWFSLDWFDAAEYAQVYWYQVLLAGVENAIRERRGNPDGIHRTVEDVKTAIGETLTAVTCCMTDAEEESGGVRIKMATEGVVGEVLCRGAELARLNVHKIEYETNGDSPRLRTTRSSNGGLM